MSDTGGDDVRQQAIARLKAKRSFKVNLGVYLVVNAVLVVIWALTKGDDDAGFWPIWTIAFWGLGLAFQAWHLYGPATLGLSEDDIQKEMGRLGGPSA